MHAQISISINTTILAYDNFNIARQEERTKLAKSAFGHLKNGVEATYPLEYMKHDLDLFCLLIPEAWERTPERIGAPPSLITTQDVPAKPEYLLKPLIHRGQPTLIYADGGTGKSVFAELVATIVATAWRDNPLHMTPATLPVRTLYLDWETNEEELRWRLCALRDGTKMPESAFLYRPCTLPFHEDVERIARTVGSEGIGFIIVDSLGGACGGDLKESEQANLYFRAMRSLGCASLTLTHITKESRDGKASSPFGSAYFWNWARSVWEMKKNQEEGENALTIGLFHRKANNTRKHAPMGFRLKFEQEGEDLKAISLNRIDIALDPNLSVNLRMSDRIATALKKGALSPQEIADKLEAKPGTVRKTLKRMLDDSLVQRVMDKWGLTEDQARHVARQEKDSSATKSATTGGYIEYPLSRRDVPSEGDDGEPLPF